MFERHLRRAHVLVAGNVNVEQILILIEKFSNDNDSTCAELLQATLFL